MFDQHSVLPDIYAASGKLLCHPPLGAGDIRRQGGTVVLLVFGTTQVCSMLCDQLNGHIHDVVGGLPNTVLLAHLPTGCCAPPSYF